MNKIFTKWLFYSLNFLLFFVFEPNLRAQMNSQFYPEVDYPAGVIPITPMAGDFNGDGILDLAVSSAGDNTVSILLGNGDGTFQPLVSYPTGGVFPTGLILGDFNNNGILDIAVSNITSNTVGVLFGNGDGTFQAPVTYPVQIGPQTLTTADLTGDGFLDLAVPNSGSNTVSVLINNGDGTFQPAVNYPVGISPQTVTFGDFNGNGFIDLAVANQGSDTISILFNNGNGTFGAPVNYATGIAPTSVAADLTSQGILDLITANFGSQNVSVFMGNGNGTFQPAVNYPLNGSPQRLQIADINGDGIMDIIVPLSTVNGFDILYGNGDGTFQPAVFYPLSSTTDAVAVGDFNGDGYLDLAFRLNTGDVVAVLLQIIPQPIITSLNPNSGTLRGGTIVEITGFGFLGTTQVHFGSNLAEFTVISNTKIIAISPPGAFPGAVPVTVTNPTGTSNAMLFTYEDVPSITSINPDAGPLSGGTRVTITGFGFLGATQVRFGSKLAEFTVISNTEIIAISPPRSSPRSVPVRVISPVGTSNALFFTYLNFPLLPRHLSGNQTFNRFVVQTDIVNILKWKSPVSDHPPLAYRIYRDRALTQLIKIIPANDKLTFKDHNRKKGKTYTYFIVSEYENGLLSKAARIKVRPR